MFGMGTDRELSVRVSGDASDFQGAMAASEASLMSFKKAAVLTTAAIGALGAALTAKATADAARFNQSMADLDAVTRATAAGMEVMESKIKSLGKSTKFLTQDIAGSAKIFAKAGFAAEETANALDGVSAAAAAAGEPIVDVSEQLIGVVNGFNMTTEETQRVADVFAQAAVSTKANINTLSKAMEYLGPIANSLGQSVEKTSAQLGMLSNSSIEAGRAGRQLRTAMLDFQRMEAGQFTQPAKEALDRLGISLQDIQSGKYSFQSLTEALTKAGATAGDMSTIFTKRAATALTILGKRGRELDDLVNNLNEAKGAARDMAETRLDTLIQQLSVLRGSVNLLMIEIGENLTPAFKDMVKGMVDTVNTMTNLVDGTKTLKEVIGPWATIIKGVAEAFKHLAVILTSYGIAKIIGGIVSTISSAGGLTAGLSGLLSSINPVIPAVIALYTAFQTLNAAVSEVPANLKDTAAAMVGMTGQTFDTIDSKEDLLQNIEVEIKRLKDLKEAERISSGEEDRLDYLKSRANILKEEIKTMKERKQEQPGREVISNTKDELEVQREKLSSLKKQIGLYDSLADAPDSLIKKIAKTKGEISELENRLEKLKGAEWIGKPAGKDFWNYMKNQTTLSLEEGLGEGFQKTSYEVFRERLKSEAKNGITQAFSGQIPMEFRVAGDYMKETIQGLSLKHTDAINALARDADLTTEQFSMLRNKINKIISETQQEINFRKKLGQSTLGLQKKLNNFKEEIGITIDEINKLKNISEAKAAFKEVGDYWEGMLKALDAGDTESFKHLANSADITDKRLVQLHDRIKTAISERENLIKTYKMFGKDTSKLDSELKKIKETFGLLDEEIKEATKSFEEKFKESAKLAGLFGNEQDVLREKMQDLKGRITTLVTGEKDKDIQSKAVQDLLGRYDKLKKKLRELNTIPFEDKLKEAATVAGIFGDETDVIESKMQSLRSEITRLITETDATKQSSEVQKLINRWKGLRDQLNQVDPALKKFADWLGVTVDEMQKQAKKMRNNINTVLDGITGILQKAGVEMPPALEGAISSVRQAGNAFASFMSGNFLQGFMQVGQAIASVFGGIKKQMEKRIEDLKKRRQDLKDRYKMAVDLVVKGMQDLSSIINNLTDLFSGPFSSAIGGALDSFISMFRMTTNLDNTQKLLQSGMEALSSITKGVISTFTSLIRKSDAYGALQDELKPIWQALGNAIADVVLPPLIALAKWMQDFFDIAKETSKAFEEVGVVDSWKRERRRFQAAQPGRIMEKEDEYEVPEWAKQIIEPIKKVLTPVFRELKSLPLKSIGKSIWKNITNLAVKWIPKIWGWIKKGMSWLKNNGNRIWNSVKDNIISLWNFFKNRIGPAWDNFVEDADKLMDGTTLGDIESSIDNIAEAIESAEGTAERMGKKGAAAGAGAAIGGGAGFAIGSQIGAVGGPAGALIGGGLGAIGGWLVGGQEGLVAKKPTLAAIAEDPSGGSEAVVPLDKLEQMINMNGEKGKIDLSVYLSGEDVTNLVVEEIKHKNRRETGMSNTSAALTGAY